MKYINRAYDLEKLVKPGQVLVLYGPRRAGKTTLIKKYTENLSVPFLSESGDNFLLQEIFNSLDTDKILNRVAGLKVYSIDEAQNIGNIGQALKIIVDNRSDLSVIATGSSSFDLGNKIGEPLVGRREVVTLYPLSIFELNKNFPKHILTDNLEKFLTYGLYPQVFNAVTNFEKESRLKEIVEGYLLKDIFSLEQIKAPGKLLYLLRLLAQYIGKPISSSKLANEININQKTVDRYLELLEKTFVIKKILPFSNKLSQSLKFKPKYYFYDLGIRNALLGNFSNVKERLEIGELFENFCIIEKIKKAAYERKTHPNFYFYQSYTTGKEIDIVEEYNGYKAFECKWESDVEKIKLEEWDKAYPNSKIQIIDKDNYFNYLI